MMPEFFIVANSFAAPFMSDTSEHWISAASASHALRTLVEEYSHPFGLYAAVCYKDANAHSKNAKPLARWLCNHEIALRKLTADLGGHTYRGNAPGDFEINGKRHVIKNPKEGEVFVT
jgi:hypothetical protein